MKPANPVLSGLGTTIFEVMSRLAESHEAVNLGQGFPDDPGPDDVRRRAAELTVDGWNQYPSMLGTPELRRAVADHAKRFYGIEADWSSEVMVTSGATEALAASILGLTEPGDEVVLLQPLYDAYAPMVRRAGAVPRFVPLRPPEWRWDPAELAAAFGPRTKAVVLNDPLNPAGKVVDTDELAELAALVIEHDTYVICDEVYEHLTFDGRRHVPLMTLPGMRERTVKIGSAGKTFSLTGWKVGYLVAAPEIHRAVARAHQFLTYTTPPNLQDAVAYGLAKDDGYFTSLASSLQRSRDRLADGLRGLGLDVLDTAGTYFLAVDVSELDPDGDDAAFCKRLTTEAGVAAIPFSAFYETDHVRHVVRFCFCKQDATLDEALERLERYLS
ncbi:MAG: aminotransferase [Actinomycetota bacterium]|nr:aminotransferase [Actinomycetota bacterium]